MKVAIVSYFAPPQPAVASHRVLRLSRALLAAGHTVHWVTLDAAKLDTRDATLDAVTPTGVVVHGLGGPNLVDRTAAGFLEKVERTIIFKLPDFLPVFDRHLEWSRRLRRELPRIVREAGIDLVLLSCGPHGQLTAVGVLRRECPSVRIVVDYRDLLSGNTWRQSKSERLRRRVRDRERRALAQVDALLLNNDNARAAFEAAMGRIEGLQIEVMRNTADYELGDRIAGLAAGPDLGEGFHLGFFGTIFAKRRMKPVLAAMARLDATTLANITAHVYCDAEGSKKLLDEDLAGFPAAVRSRVARHDLLGYGDALRAMRAMDALLLINSPDPADQIFVPGKLYDYLMAQRPVLFLGAEGDACRIIAATSGPQWCFGCDEPDRVAALLTEVARVRPPTLKRSAEHEPSCSFAPLLRLLDGARRTAS